MNRLKAMMFVTFLTSGAMASSTSDKTEYRCQMIPDNENPMGLRGVGFTVLGQSCSKPHGYFGSSTKMEPIPFISCFVIKNTETELEIRFNDADPDGELLYAKLRMSKQTFQGLFNETVAMVCHG